MTRLRDLFLTIVLCICIFGCERSETSNVNTTSARWQGGGFYGVKAIAQALKVCNAADDAAAVSKVVDQVDVRKSPFSYLLQQTYRPLLQKRILFNQQTELPPWMTYRLKLDSMKERK